MRIAINARALTWEKTGIGNYILHLIFALAKIDQKNEYIIFYDPIHTRGLIPFPIQENFEVAPCPQANFWEQICLPTELEKRRIDLLHAPAFTIPLIKVCKTVVTFHDITYKLFPDNLHKGSTDFYNKWVPIAARDADMIITDSACTAKDIIEHYSVPKDKIETIHLSCAQGFRRLSCIDFSFIRQQYGIKGRYLLYVGTLEMRKNIRRILEAFSLLTRRKGMEYQFLLVGKQRPWFNIDEIIEELDLKDLVVLAGYVKDSVEYPDKIEIIPHGAPSIVTGDATKLRRKFNIKSNHVIASFGFMRPYKGFYDVLEALVTVKQKYPDILYLLVASIRSGEKESLEHYWTLRRAAHAYGLNGNVRFYHNFLNEPEIQEILQLADILVLYYRFNHTNATSAAVRFALATMRPVIVSKINFFADLDLEVFKVEPNSPAKIAQAIIALFEDEALQAQLFRNARKLIMNTSWPKVAKKHLQMYSKVMEAQSVYPNRKKNVESASGQKKTRKSKSISVCYIVYNEEQFLEYSLKSIYDFADQIIIVDGSPQGPSTDHTKAIIDSFGTEKIIYNRGTFMTKEEQRNEYLKYVTSDWILVVDGDEIYKYSHLQRLREIIETRHDIFAIHFGFIHFWKDFEHYKIGGDFSRIPFRCSIYQKGMYYKVHHSLANSEGQFIDYLPNVYYDSTIKVYHYGYVKSTQDIRAKMIYYAKRGDVGAVHQRNPEAFADDYVRNKWKLDSPLVYRYLGEHPEAIQPLIEKMGGHIETNEGKNTQ